MTNIQLDLEVQPRSTFGKNSNRRLRAEGQVPAVVYGGDREPTTIQLSARTLREIQKKAGDNAVFLLKLAGTDQSRHVMIREQQVDPLNGATLHLDFQRIDLKEKVVVTVSVELVGTPAGVKNDGGVLDFVTREVEVETLPTQIPSRLEIDVSKLEIGDHLEAKDVEMPEGVELIEDPSRVIVSVAIPQRPEEEVEEEEGLLVEADQAEPERIGRTRQEESEGETEAEG